MWVCERARYRRCCCCCRCCRFCSFCLELCSCCCWLKIEGSRFLPTVFQHGEISATVTATTTITITIRTPTPTLISSNPRSVWVEESLRLDNKQHIYITTTNHHTHSHPYVIHIWRLFIIMMPNYAIATKAAVTFLRWKIVWMVNFFRFFLSARLGCVKLGICILCVCIRIDLCFDQRYFLGWSILALIPCMVTLAYTRTHGARGARSYSFKFFFLLSLYVC